jgi:hypothetical protein
MESKTSKLKTAQISSKKEKPNILIKNLARKSLLSKKKKKLKISLTETNSNLIDKPKEN